MYGEQLSLGGHGAAELHLHAEPTLHREAELLFPVEKQGAYKRGFAEPGQSLAPRAALLRLSKVVSARLCGQTTDTGGVEAMGFEVRLAMPHRRRKLEIPVRCTTNRRPGASDSA